MLRKFWFTSRVEHLNPTSFRAEIQTLKRDHFVLTREMHEIVDPVARQRVAREIATLESRLIERGVPH